MRKSNRSRYTAVLGGVVVLALTATGTVSAQPKPDGVSTGVAESGVVPGGFKSWGELRATQQKLNAAADRIAAAGGDGFAGVVAAPEKP